jgi:hypothetical protein
MSEPQRHDNPPELHVLNPRTMTFDPDFPDASDVSAWRLRLFPGKPGVSDLFLPK